MQSTIRTVLLGLLAALVAAGASADVTMTAQTGGKGLGMAMDGENTVYLKGLKMRSDIVVRGDTLSTIIDLDGQKFISLNHKKKEAEVWDMGQLSGSMQKITNADVKVAMTPNGQTQQIAGESCDGYDMRASVGFSPGGDQQMTIVMAGPVWIAKNSPAKSDWTRFYKAAVEKGLFVSDPKTAKAQPGIARGLSRLYDAMADAGVSYGQEIRISFEGGPLAAMMSKMGGSTITNTVQKVSVGPLGDDLFVVPAGYKVKESK